MATKYSKLATATVPQSEPLDARQVKNSAGGFVYQLDKWARLDRFLVIGSDASTYYASARKLTRENAAVINDCYADDPARTVATITAVSESGRAPKNDPAIFALAVGAAHADVKVRAMALAAMPKVCRIGTHLFQFVDNVRSLGKGWGRALKRAVGNWYDSKTVEQVGYQAIKYRQREGYSHARLLKTAHPSGEGAGALISPQRKALYRWIRGLSKDRAEFDLLPSQVQAHIVAMLSESKLDEVNLVELVTKARLPWEAIPTSATTDPKVWEAMLPDMGLTAMIRNLGNMTRYGTIAPMNANEKLVVARLGNENDIRKSRIHPFNVLLAQATYGSGQGFRGNSSWQPSQPIMAALNDAFYKAFTNVVPTGKRRLVALDVSGSMSSPFMGSPMTVRAASSAMALITLNTEQNTHIIGFTAGVGRGRTAYSPYGGRDGVTPLPINAKMSVDQVVKLTNGLPFGRTDCAQPMLYAMEKGIEVDCFEIYTDNETWHGTVHPMEALRQYRKKTGIAAKLVVVGMTATEFSIADPADGGAMDFVGFDSAAPSIMADFIRR